MSMFLSPITSAPPLSFIRCWVYRLLIWTIDLLYLIVILSILFLAMHILGSVLYDLSLFGHSAYTVLLVVLNSILFLLMLTELLYSMALALKTHMVPKEQLVALLWMALVRHGVVMTQTAHSLATPNGAATIAGLIVLGVWLDKKRQQKKIFLSPSRIPPKRTLTN